MSEVKVSNTGAQYATLVMPVIYQGQNANVASNATGSSWTVLSANTARQVTFGNNSGTTIEIQQDGNGPGFPIFDQNYFTFYGLTNTNQLAIRRADQSSTVVSINYRWEL